MRTNFRRKYKEFVGEIVSFGLPEGTYIGKLIKIKGKDFHFNPYIKNTLTREQNKIYWKKVFKMI